MNTRIFLLCSLLLAPLVALPKDKPVKVMIYSGTQPTSAGGETKLVADWFEGQVLQGIMDKYPCVQVTTASAAKDVLEWNRQRELLGSGSGIDLQNLAGALGVNYIISLTVTEMGSGELALNASMASGSNGSTQARGGEVTKGGEAALDAAEAAGKRFVDGLSSLKKFTKEYCDPTNRWTGTITFKRVQHHEDHSERPAGSGEGTVSMTATSTLSQNVTVNIPWAGKPKASITVNGSTRTEEVGKVRIDCARVRIAKHQPEWKSAGWDHVTRTEQTASGGGEANVSVTIGHDKYEIAVDLPEIESTTTYTVTKHNDGGCGKPTDDSPAPVKVPEKLTLRLPPIDMPLQKPDKLQGSNRDELGGIITWYLTRTPKKE